MIRNRKLLSEIAIERIHKLISMSKSRALGAGTGDALSRRYVSIAKDISDHYRIREKSLDDAVCSGCGEVMIPGVNASVRLVGSYGYIAYRCRCGEEKHVHYGKSFGSEPI